MASTEQILWSLLENETHRGVTLSSSPSRSVSRRLLGSPDEYETYCDAPEAFVYEEHLARETDSLRKCGERCLLTLADTAECRQPVQQAVLELSNEAALHGLATLPSVLALIRTNASPQTLAQIEQAVAARRGQLTTLQDALDFISGTTDRDALDDIDYACSRARRKVRPVARPAAGAGGSTVR